MILPYVGKNLRSRSLLIHVETHGVHNRGLHIWGSFSANQVLHAPANSKPTESGHHGTTTRAFTTSCGKRPATPIHEQTLSLTFAEPRRFSVKQSFYMCMCLQQGATASPITGVAVSN